MYRVLKIMPLILSLLGCDVKHPGLWKSGEYDCKHCKMQIEDLRFKTAVITKKGKLVSFDSIECLLEWSKKNNLQIKDSFVADFNRPNDWIKFKKSFILQSNKRPSPMGSGFSAYSSQDELLKALNVLGGKQINIP